MVRSFGGLSNWTHSRVDRWRFLTKHSCFIRPRIVFRLEHFCRNALWREFYQVFTFSIARRRGLRNDTAIAVNCSEFSNLEKMFQRDANSSPHYRGLKFAPFFLLWKMETASIIYIKVKNWKKIWQTFYPIKFSFNF